MYNFISWLGLAINKINNFYKLLQSLYLRKKKKILSAHNVLHPSTSGVCIIMTLCHDYQQNAPKTYSRFSNVLSFYTHCLVLEQLGSPWTFIWRSEKSGDWRGQFETPAPIEALFSFQNSKMSFVGVNFRTSIN